MQFTLLITASPSTPFAVKALDFTRAVLQLGHGVERLFFFADGVEQARESTNIAQEWQELMDKHGLAVTVCSGSAGERRLGAAQSLLPIGGMGDWLMATLESERLVCF